ncbi:MAG: glycosyltransferase [Rhodospirillales bacterium]|nr:glycosyltransferase [Rhodospirillales bacterium]
MSDPSSVLFVSRYYWPELIGSAPFSTDIAEWLAAHGRPTTVVSGLPHYPHDDVFPAYRDGRCQRETVCGVAVERLSAGPPRGGSAVARIVNEAEFLLRGLTTLVTGRIRRHPVVLALCPSILSVALGVAARRRGGVCIAVVHDIQSGLAEKLGMGGGNMARLMRAAERSILNRTDLVAVLSSEMRDQLRSIGVTAPIEVIPLWVDTDHIQAAPAVARPGVKVLYSGNLGRKQGLGQVVELARELSNRRLDIEIVLRGNGNQAGDLLEQIRSLGLTNIQLAELQPNEELGPALAAGDIHLVPQRPDAAAFAVPSKVFNIMAVGRPFVATALPDSVLWRLQRQSGAFLCVPPDDPPTFAEAVIRLADDGRLRQELGRRGREFVEAHYAKPRILGHLVDRLDAIAAAK